MPQMMSPAAASKAYQAEMSAWPIKVLTLTLFAMTAGLAVQLYQEKKYPWQQGYKLSDLRTLVDRKR